MTGEKQESDEAAVAATQKTAAGKQPILKWDDSSMSTSYANVCNVSVTREECGLFFGTNLTTGISAADEVTIKLSDRIIMTPHAAKRLLVLLDANLRAYEERHGELDIQPPTKR